MNKEVEKKSKKEYEGYSVSKIVDDLDFVVHIMKKNISV